MHISLSRKAGRDDHPVHYGTVALVSLFPRAVGFNGVISTRSNSIGFSTIYMASLSLLRPAAVVIEGVAETVAVGGSICWV